jgi:hypothetical protein
MIRLILSILISAVTWFQFLDWARGKTEGQINKMQEAAFNTPGADAPVPIAVLMAGVSVVTAHFTVGRFLRLRRWQTLTSLMLGLGAGVFLFAKRVQ